MLLELLILTALVWLISTFFESWHDWHLHSTLYGPNARWQDKDKLKTLDGLEKSVFLAGFSTLAFGMTGDVAYVVAFSTWQAWLRWLGHEAWYSWFSSTTFGKMGASSFVDNALNYLGLGVWGNRALLILPVVVLALVLYNY